jgi:serine phosphatase RsbU (regulator of sigma subunit)
VTALSSGTPPAPTEMQTILLIEDDAGDAFLVEELLAGTPAPPKIIWARTLAEGHQRLTDEVQCVVVDLSLPDATGLEALRQVLAMAPNTAVLVLTGLNDAHVGVEAVAAGAQDYLIKQDVDERLLARAISYAVERKRADLAQRKLADAQHLSRENARLEHGLLPVPMLKKELVSEGLQHQARYLPGRRQALLAGDFWDTVQTPDGAVHVVIGDVCGHGPDEAALGVALRIAWRTLVLAGHMGNDLLITLEAMLRNERKSPEIFTTMCTVTIAPDLRTARLHVVGHPPPLFVRGGVRGGELDVVPGAPSGPPLGIFTDVTWSTIELELGDDWSMLLYTDGLIEATVGGGPDLLGTEGLIRLVREQGEIDLDRIITAVQEMHRDALSDDLAAVLVGRRSL